jgi:hypothetical protein
MGQEQVVLNLSYAFHLKVFELSLEGVQASLSFSGQESLCVIPWESVYFIRLASGEEEGAIYLESMPMSVRQLLLHAAGVDIELDESDDGDLEDLSYDLSSSLDDESLPIVSPTPPRPALRRADQVSEDSLDGDESWIEGLPRLNTEAEESRRERAEALMSSRDSEEGADGVGDEGEAEEGGISFQAFLKHKQGKG